MNITDLWTKAKASDATQFSRHPIGDWAGIVTGIEEDTYEGKMIYRLVIETEAGEARHAVWDLGQDDLDKMGEDKFMKALAHRKRLVVDLGQPEPNTYEEWLGALGQCVGAKCLLVVKPNPKKDGEVVTYVNAPDASKVGHPGNVVGKPVGGLARPKPQAQAASKLRQPGY